MCKYCDVKRDIYGTPAFFGEEMLMYARTSCKISYSEGYGYSLYVAGETEECTDKISFCPFCGRKLED